MSQPLYTIPSRPPVKQQNNTLPTPVKPPSKALNFVQQQKLKSQGQPALGAIKTPPDLKTSTNTPIDLKTLAKPGEQYCRKNYSVFGQITYPVIATVIILIVFTVFIYFSVKYYKTKVMLASGNLITSPINLGTTLIVPNSNSTPSMLSNQFSYQFWLYLNPPKDTTTQNYLIFIREPTATWPNFCIYTSNNGSILNIASLAYSNSNTPPTPTTSQLSLIQSLQFDQLSDFYIVNQTSQISLYKWFLVSIVGYQNQVVLYINGIPFDSQIQSSKNNSLVLHSGSIYIAPKNYNLLTNSYISKLHVYNYPITQNTMTQAQKYGPQ